MSDEVDVGHRGQPPEAAIEILSIAVQELDAHPDAAAHDEPVSVGGQMDLIADGGEPELGERLCAELGEVAVPVVGELVDHTGRDRDDAPVSRRSRDGTQDALHDGDRGAPSPAGAVAREQVKHPRARAHHRAGTIGTDPRVVVVHADLVEPGREGELLADRPFGDPLHATERALCERAAADADRVARARLQHGLLERAREPRRRPDRRARVRCIDRGVEVGSVGGARRIEAVDLIAAEEKQEATAAAHRTPTAARRSRSGCSPRG